MVFFRSPGERFRIISREEILRDLGDPMGFRDDGIRWEYENLFSKSKTSRYSIRDWNTDGSHVSRKGPSCSRSSTSYDCQRRYSNGHTERFSHGTYQRIQPGSVPPPPPPLANHHHYIQRYSNNHTY